jgi:short-subunit dehydrogenase
MMPFEHQVALITGASSGIGWALAKELSKQKCKVGLIARRGDRLAALAEEIRLSGGKAAIAVADVANRPQVLEAIKSVRQELGPVDLLIANSGIGTHTPLKPMDVERVEYMMRVNIFGVIYAIEGVLPEMLERGRGHLAAMSSLGSYKGYPGESGYCASKAAINVYMEGLRIQLRNKGIAVTTICPGFIRTAMTDTHKFRMPWLMEPDKAAGKIVRALGRRTKVYNFPWQTSCLTKFSCWMPDWLMARTLNPYTIESPTPE